MAAFELESDEMIYNRTLVINPVVLRRCQFRDDGLVPTAATRSSLYSMGLGRELSLAELATLTLGRMKWLLVKKFHFGIWCFSMQAPQIPT